MSNVVIGVYGVSKQYRLGTFRETTLRAQVGGLVQRFAGKHAHEESSAATIWALSNISFEVKKGEVIGIVGRNGSGKSTLLKILARVTKPTTGWFGINGTVGSLLGVGTGFSPELTGRENIYLNGAILGLNRSQIDERYDEIVAFSEIEKFIDTPVKRYSSGMHTRLAFSIASHLTAEILLVDEVLAVGDAAFKEKSLARMHHLVREEGRTVLFVSHDAGSIRNLCQRCLYLKEGILQSIGPTESILHEYYSAVAQ